MSQRRRILRNSIFGVASEAIGGGLSFLIVLIIARSLGSERFGRFSFILALVGIFQLVADFGLTNVLVREIARDRENAAHIVGAIKPLVWIFSLIIFSLIGALSQLFSFTPDETWATLLMSGAVLATFHAVIYGSVCRAFEEMGFNAAGFVTHKIVLLAFVLLALSSTSSISNLTAIASAYLAANLYQWGFFFLIVRHRYVRVRWCIDVSYWKYLLKEAFPIGIAMVFRRITLHVDTLLLAILSTTTSVGLFSAAYKIIQMVDMIPFTLAIPLFPPFARLAHESKHNLFPPLIQALRMFAFISVPIFIWLIILAPTIIRISFGVGYLESVTTLRVLTAAVLFLFPTSLFIYVFSALNKQKYYTVSSGTCLATNLLLDLALIPFFDHLGAAIATLIAEIMFFLHGILMLRRLGCMIPFTRLITKPFLAAGIASIALAWAFKSDSVPIFLAGSIGYAVFYCILIIMFKMLHPEELALLRASLKLKAKT